MVDRFPYFSIIIMRSPVLESAFRFLPGRPLLSLCGRACVLAHARNKMYMLNTARQQPRARISRAMRSLSWEQPPHAFDSASHYRLPGCVVDPREVLPRGPAQGRASRHAPAGFAAAVALSLSGRRGGRILCVGGWRGLASRAAPTLFKWRFARFTRCARL